MRQTATILQIFLVMFIEQLVYFIQATSSKAFDALSHILWNILFYEIFYWKMLYKMWELASHVPDPKPR